MTRSELEASGEGPYRSFADEVVERAWKPMQQPLVDCWYPFVDGETSDRRTAIHDLLVAIAVPVDSRDAQ